MIEHASCVAVGEAGALILGPSGAGKSRLALELIALGATLVADDRVVLRREGDVIVASPPKPLKGLVEARGIGLLQTECAATAILRLVVDLGTVEQDRLPPLRMREVLGLPLPVLLCKDMPGVASALYVLLKSGGVRRAP
jgi:HPr kinase/phosphorylase